MRYEFLDNIPRIRPNSASVDRNLPPVRIPLTRLAEIGGFPRTKSLRSGRPNIPQRRIIVGKNCIPGMNPTHVFVELITSATLFTLRGPQKASFDFVSPCLVLIDPPICHVLVPFCLTTAP